MPWQELIKIALIGTNRTPISPNLSKALDQLGVDTKQEATAAVLEGAALYSLMQKAGGLQRTWPHPLTKLAPKEHAATCSTTSTHHLSLILNGTFENALPEFVEKMVDHRKRIPPELLPDLLERCLTEPILWKSIREVMGLRGSWLLEQNAKWKDLNFRADTTQWEFSRRDDRVLMLKQLRATHPNQALELITATWEEDDLSSRVQFMKSLAHHLSEKDEAFLEEKLDNSRKEIRKIAAELLGKLPHSDLNKRMFERLKSLLFVKKGRLKKKRLEVTLPEQSDDGMLRDGIDPSAQWYKGGVKASRLGQMMSSIPPQQWNTHFGTTTSDTLTLIIRSEWSELMLQAIAEASAIHKDEEWIEVILNFWLDNYHNQQWNYFNPEKLLDDLSPPTFNKIVLQNIQQTNSLLDEESPLTIILRKVNHPWEDPLAIAVIRNMQKWISGETAHYWSGWHLRSILKQGAYLCNPNLLETLSKGWTQAGHTWEKEIDAFLSTIKFRKEMHEALEQ